MSLNLTPNNKLVEPIIHIHKPTKKCVQSFGYENDDFIVTLVDETKLKNPCSFDFIYKDGNLYLTKDEHGFRKIKSKDYT